MRHCRSEPLLGFKKKTLHAENGTTAAYVTESSLELKSWCPGYALRGLGISFWNAQLGKHGQKATNMEKSP